MTHTTCDLCGKNVTRNAVRDSLVVHHEGFEAQIFIGKLNKDGRPEFGKGDVCEKCALVIVAKGKVSKHAEGRQQRAEKIEVRDGGIRGPGATSGGAPRGIQGI